FGAKSRVNCQVVINIVAMVTVGVVFEDGRQPDGGAAETSNVVEIVSDTPDVASEKGIGRADAGRATGAGGDRARYVVLEAIHHEEVDEFFAPLAVDTEVPLAGHRRQIDFFD